MGELLPDEAGADASAETRADFNRVDQDSRAADSQDEPTPADSAEFNMSDDPERAELVVEFLDSATLSGGESSLRTAPPGGEDRGATAANSSQPPRIPGPGLPESLAWTFGVFPVQILGMIVATVFVAMYYVLVLGTDNFQHLFQNLDSTHLAPLIGGMQLVFVSVTLLAVVLRLGMGTKRRLSFIPMGWGHAALIMMIILPLALVSGQLMSWTMQVWEAFVTQFPQYSQLKAWLDQNQSMVLVESLSQQLPLGSLLLIVAVAPALGEELIFRGVIGRGLVARWGLAAGVLMTSMLFAFVHLHPAHVVALMPLAITIHVLYFATRSFWAPMLVHFLNNAWAVVVLKYRDQLNIEELAEDVPLAPEVVLTSIICVVAITVLIWKTRVQYHLPDGSLWTPGYPTVEQPPKHVSAVAKRERVDAGWVAFAVVSFLVFAATFVRSL